MNEMQMSLLGLGGLAIVLVLIYNRWLERKHRNKIESEARAQALAHESPVDGGTSRQEPAWDHDHPVQSLAVAHEEDAAAVLADDGVPLAEPRGALTEVESWVDACATLRFYEPRTAGSVNSTIRQMGADRFDRVEGYTGDAWYACDGLPASTAVSNLRCRLQLASRRGPVSPDALHAWMCSVENLAQLLSAGLTVETEAHLLERANNLDAFCARVDALISLNLQAKSDTSSTMAAFTTRAPGMGLVGDFPAFVRLNEQGTVEFHVDGDMNAGRIVLTLDVPNVSGPDTVVHNMFHLAQDLAAILDADIRDDVGRPLDSAGLALLSNQVVRLNAAMQAQGIEPGSPLARRLFS